MNHIEDVQVNVALAQERTGSRRVRFITQIGQPAHRDSAHVGMNRAQPRDRLDTGAAQHVEIDEHDVGVAPELDRVVAVVSRAHHEQAVAVLKVGTERVGEGAVVISDDHAHKFGRTSRQPPQQSIRVPAVDRLQTTDLISTLEARSWPPGAPGPAPGESRSQA
jgi:hypothetical protein